MKRIVILSILGGALLLTQCAPKHHTAVTATSGDRAAEIKKKYSDEDLAAGKQLFDSHCDRCHKQKMPETRTVAQWERILPNMMTRSKLNDREAAQVRAYVLLHAKVE